MFLKQYNYKPRSGSVSSQESAGSAASSPPKDSKLVSSSIQQQAAAAATTTTTAAAAAAANQPKGPGARRRSSTTDKFAGLTAHKRNQDPAKKASIADQTVGGQGLFGGVWNSFTKG